MTHPLHPLPQRLAKLLVNGASGLPDKCDRWISAQSQGRYTYLHHWLDAEDNLDERMSLGNKLCEIIENGNISELES